ncbi:McrB family protein [Anaerofustis stercorihominis]|uniref:McrB family protein n=1 Tax=Anaerofustis stercorihominis TaxID=214853 RepID=UPI00214C6B9E|nr:AAA family ATPase [Anaerofustis stercorihominis]MCR2032355.1 AAA family ATPase [Anaerofustis stercorihominis]
MGKIVMPKNSALLNEIESVLKIYYEANDWIPNDSYKTRLKALIGDDQYSSSYTKKAQITSYFGFTVWQDIRNPQSFRRITPSGKQMYEALQKNDTEKVQEVLLEALEQVKFGRDNYGCPDSNTDIEPPTLFIRAILDLGYLTYREFAWLLWKLEDLGANYTDSLQELRKLRSQGPIQLGDEANKYADCKPIMILVRWGFLAEDESANASNGKHIVIADEVLKKYQSRLRNLKIYNIDKDIIDASSFDFENDNNEDDNEKKFRAWMAKQVTVNGTPCTASMISNNCSALKKVCSLMEIAEYPDLESIFEIVDMDVFVEVKNIIQSHPDYEEVNKACNNRFLSTGLKWYEKFLNEMLQDISSVESGEQNEKEEIDLEAIRLSSGENVLLYGVPGSGKSWTIEHEYCKPGSVVERLVFHPDYTYSDFIGQILPAVAEDGQVSYKFTPGPFTNILRESYNNPGTEYILIIEEINRGNAPAIFGEVFQLLDRKVEIRDIDDDGFPVGTSEYGITNMNIAEEMYGKERKTDKVRIPSNLSIIGTMNTSDQNVFTLDTAFQRRWDMRLIENDFENVDPTLANAEILDTTVTWRNFCVEINRIVVGNSARMTSAEDKRLGAYFVHLRDLKFNDAMGDLKEYDALRKKESKGTLTPEEKTQIAVIRDAMRQNRKFPEKVIKYLWDDAFKFNREVIFEVTEYQSLEQVIRAFMYAKGLDRFKVFKDNVQSAFTGAEEE